MSTDDPEIRPVDTADELDAVKDIYLTQKALLGFLPEGAFQQRADSKQIFIAFVDGEVAGLFCLS